VRRVWPTVTALASGPAIAGALGVLGVVLLAAAVPPALIAGDLSAGSVVSEALVVLSFGGVGLVVARRQPRNAVGWILLASAVLLAASNAAGSYAALIYHFGHGGLPLGPVAALLDLLWAPAIVLIALAILLFPDGTLPSPRWRWVLRSYVAAGACWPVSIYIVAIATLISGHFQVTAGGDLTIVDQPTGSAAWLTPVQELTLPVLVVFWLVFVGRQVASFRRASHERRQQLKWLMSGAAACLLGGALVTVVGSLDAHPSSLATAAIDLASVATIAFPLSIGVGILKYRLYDIDRIISRTLAYAIITGLLIGVYAGLVLLVTEVLAVTTPVAVAVATLTAAALFSPVRRRVQRAVDRRFNRSRYDADQAVAAFAARLKDAVDHDAVRADLLSVVQRALEPAHASVWIDRR
jgi:hypothetical protein